MYLCEEYPECDEALKYLFNLLISVLLIDKSSLNLVKKW